MPALNIVLLSGNLTRAPEVRYTSGGKAVCTFGLAVSRSYTRKDGSRDEEVCFVDIRAWGKQAEQCRLNLKKGSPAFIEGMLTMDTWSDKRTGAKRSKLLINAESVQFLKQRNRAGETPF